MKKLLSLIMVVLAGFLNYGVRGYKVDYLPDGGKRITYAYGELQQLSEKHRQLLAEVVNDISIRGKRYDHVKAISSISSVLCIVCGAIMCIDKDIKNGDAIPGIALCTLGVLGLIGIPKGLNYSIDKLKGQKYAIEERMNVIEDIKQSVDMYISNSIVTLLDVNKKFFYSLFVDKDNFVYQVEYSEAGIFHDIVSLKTKYKLNMDWWI